MSSFLRDVHRVRSAAPFLAASLCGALWLSACAGPSGSTPASGPTVSDASEPGPSASRRPPPEARPLHHTPTGLLPAAAPISTFGEDGERIDPIASLQGLLESGEVVFSFDSVTGYLPSLLSALDIPVSSQSLIFSRTSLQTEWIAPWAPRAVYFNDDVYIGFVHNDLTPLLEIASIDPDDGAAFYILRNTADMAPSFERETRLCLGCHSSRDVTEGVPGVMVRSTLTDRMGRVIKTLSEGPTTDQTPWEERLGGFYVTGTHGGAGHGGNVRATLESHEVDNGDTYLADFDLTTGGNVTTLSDRFDTSVYLSEHSDLVAILVLTHQTRVHNLITWAAEESAEALRLQEATRVSRGIEIPESGMTATTEVRIEEAVDRLVRSMMFVREAPLPGPVAGTSNFAEEFSALGPYDSQGRTLREFDLNERLFRYPLSFLIYTEAFDALPGPMKTQVYGRIEAVLTGRDGSGDFEHIDQSTRGAIREILIATKPDFAAFVR